MKVSLFRICKLQKKINLNSIQLNSNYLFEIDVYKINFNYKIVFYNCVLIIFQCLKTCQVNHIFLLQLSEMFDDIIKMRKNDYLANIFHYFFG